MHASIIYPWDLDQHGAHQSHLWSKFLLSWQLGSCPPPRELLLAHKPAIQQENGREWRYKVCPEWEGRSTKEERTGSRCHPRAFAGSSRTCCDKPPPHILHSLCLQASMREDKLPYTYPPFWPSQKLEIGLKQISAGQAGKIWPSLWQRRT